MLRHDVRQITPHNGWKYRVEETGTSFSGVDLTFPGIVSKVSAHLKANGLEIPANLGDLIDDFTCRANNGEGCEETDPRKTFLQTLSLTWKVLEAGTKTIGSWALSGFKKVDQGLADSRSVVCASCPHNVNTDGCSTCQSDALHKLIGSIIGKSRSSQHDKLRACNRCGCSLQVKVFSPLAHIVKSEPIYALPEWCWIVKEQSNG